MYGDVFPEAVLRKRFFVCYQREDETLSQYANGLQELMATLQKKEDFQQCRPGRTGPIPTGSKELAIAECNARKIKAEKRGAGCNNTSGTAG